MQKSVCTGIPPPAAGQIRSPPARIRSQGQGCRTAARRSVLLTGASDDARGGAAGAAAPAAEPTAAGASAVLASAARTGQAAGACGLPARLALPAALTGGLALAAAFPPVGAWPLAAVGPALLAVALWRRSMRGSMAVGLVFGLAFFFPLLSWLVNVAWYAWAALAVTEAVIFAVLAVGQRLLLSLRAWPLAVAGWWVAAEAVRARWPYAFPWGRLAMSQAGAPTARWAAVGGAPLLTFVVALAGAALAWLVLASSRRGERAGMLRRRLVPAVAFADAAGLALAGALLPADPGSAGTRSAIVAAIQGD